MTGSGATEPARQPRTDQPWRSWPVGARAMVRRRLPEGDTHLFTDVLGDLVAVDDDGVTLRTRLGEDVRVPGTQIAIGKLLPPAPVRRPRPADG